MYTPTRRETCTMTSRELERFLYCGKDVHRLIIHMYPRFMAYIYSMIDEIVNVLGLKMISKRGLGLTVDKIRKHHTDKR